MIYDSCYSLERHLICFYTHFVCLFSTSLCNKQLHKMLIHHILICFTIIYMSDGISLKLKNSFKWLFTYSYINCLKSAGGGESRQQSTLVVISQSCHLLTRSRGIHFEILCSCNPQIIMNSMQISNHTLLCLYQ